MNHILAAIDFGPAATAVCEHAAEIAVRCGARLTLFHAYQSIDGDGDGVRATTSAAPREAERQLAAYAEALRGRYGGALRVEREVRETFAGAGILGYAGRVDLTVIGQTERHGVYRFLLGNTTGRVIDGARAPVLVVPAPTAHATQTPRDILFALDERLPSAATLAPLRELVRVLDSGIEVYRVLDDPAHRDHDGELGDLLEAVPWTYHLERGGGDLAAFINARPGYADGTWLCLAHRPRVPIARALLRSLSDRVAAIVPVPVLVLVGGGEPAAKPTARRRAGITSG